MRIGHTRIKFVLGLICFTKRGLSEHCCIEKRYSDSFCFITVNTIGFLPWLASKRRLCRLRGNPSLRSKASNCKKRHIPQPRSRPIFVPCLSNCRSPRRHLARGHSAIRRTFARFSQVARKRPSSFPCNNAEALSNKGIKEKPIEMSYHKGSDFNRFFTLFPFRFRTTHFAISKKRFQIIFYVSVFDSVFQSRIFSAINNNFFSDFSVSEFRAFQFLFIN